MSAETLHTVATLMREQHGPDHKRHEMWSAMANLLDNEASLIEGASEYPDLHLPLNEARVDLLLAVARAYLGEQA